jgi:hypothetical protein
LNWNRHEQKPVTRTNAWTPSAADLSGPEIGTRHTAVNPKIKTKTG